MSTNGTVSVKRNNFELEFLPGSPKYYKASLKYIATVSIFLIVPVQDACTCMYNIISMPILYALLIKYHYDINLTSHISACDVLTFLKEMASKIVVVVTYTFKKTFLTAMFEPSFTCVKS